MRNLVPVHRGVLSVRSISVPDLPLVGSEFDAVNDSMVCTFGPTGEFASVEIQQISKSGDVQILASWPLPEHELPEDETPETPKVLSSKYFADTDNAVVVLSNGDIFNVARGSNDEDSVVEMVGSIDSTILDASWSPDEEILAIATAGTLTLLSRIFEPISETSIRLSDLSISKHVSVGWGKKETQFEGKGAKALRDPTMPEKVDSGIICESDSPIKVRVSWRGDGEYVAISSIDELADSDIARRTIRVYSRDGALSSVSEPVDTQEAEIAWRPSGNLIAAVQRSSPGGGPAPDLIFFEKNGLRRNEFSLRVDPSADSVSPAVKGLAWNVDSDVLSVHIENTIQLWTVSNYQWHLKQVVLSRIKTGELLWVRWHPEKHLTLLACYECPGFEYRLESHSFVYSVISGPTLSPNDYGTTVVLDGCEVKVTPLKIANTPPPMAFRKLVVDDVPIHVAVNSSNDRFAILTEKSLLIAEWSITDPRTIKAPTVVKTIPLDTILPDDTVPKQVAYVENLVAIAVDELVGTTLLVLEFDIDLEFTVAAVHDVASDLFLLRAQSDFKAFVFETVEGKMHRIAPPSLGLVESDTISCLPERCVDFQVSSGYEKIEASDEVSVTPTVYGLTDSGRLYANERQIATAVMSLAISDSHVIFTTAKSLLKFCHLDSDVDKIVVPTDENDQIDERCRSIERGSLLVSVVPSNTAIILQAPRGNLETIHPRVMVLTEIRRNITDVRYDLAFKACRVHRVDLNLLYDYDPFQFFENIETFIKQLNSVEYLDLFLSGLKEDDVSVTMYASTLPADGEAVPRNQFISKVNDICDRVLSVLDTGEHKSKYLQSRLTAHACKAPPDLEAALRVVKGLYEKDRAASETAIQHLCFLQDVELLYKTSLGIYDLPLTLLVAQQSQKDPKEYLPFLNNIQAQSETRGKFLIDDYLKRYSQALRHLVDLDEDVFDEVVDYVVDHELYKDALGLFKYSEEKQKKITEVYADFLRTQSQLSEAGLAYEVLGKHSEAIEAYTQARDWGQALSLAQSTLKQDQVLELASQLAESTLDNRMYLDSAVIHWDYLHQPEESVRILCQGYIFDQAIRITAVIGNSKLLTEIVDPGLLDGFRAITELVSACKSQHKSQRERLDELRFQKLMDPMAFYAESEHVDAPDNVSLAPTETSTTPSFMTQYTGKSGSTAQTGVSRRTAKNRRKEERKRARGKKGSVYEEEYLINSTGRLVERLDQAQADAVQLINGLLRRNMTTHAYQIQRAFVDIFSELSQHIEGIYTQSEKDRLRYDDDGNIYYLPEVPPPAIPSFPGKHILDY